MNNIINKKENLLSIPIIDNYYTLIEIMAYYFSLKHVEASREAYPLIIDSINSFLSLTSKEETTTMLNTYIYNNNNKLRTNKQMELINPIGYKLLDMNNDIDIEELKKLYKKAAKKHHPDVGGSNEKMQNINEAYEIYFDYLLNDQYNWEEDFSAKGEIKTGEGFYSLLLMTQLHIYLDSWKLLEAYDIACELLRKEEFESLQELYSPTNIAICSFELSSKLTSIDKYDLALDIYNKISVFRKTYNQYNLKSNFEKTKSIIDKKLKYKIVIKSSLMQVENCYKIGAINKSRYDSYLKKMTQEETIKQTEKVNTKLILDSFLKVNDFIELPYDKKLIAKKLTKYIPELSKEGSYDIYTCTSFQQAEYIKAFKVSPSLELVNKYSFARLSSYFHSLKEYEYGKLNILTILEECSLLASLWGSSSLIGKNYTQYTNDYYNYLEQLNTDNKDVYMKMYDLMKEKFFRTSIY